MNYKLIFGLGLIPPGVVAKKPNYLTFTSPEPFTIAVNNAAKNWDGTLYYSTDAANWNEWDGTTAISSAEHGGGQKIYMRGSGNSQISYAPAFYQNRRWVLTGNDIRCYGNIETLLDYTTVQNGEHPTMGVGCFYALFLDCTSLIQAPELPSAEMTKVCYAFMFRGCTGLVVAPMLPAINLYQNCYSRMFEGCTSLVQLPKLPATALEYGCYREMCKGCTSLKMSTTQSDEYPYEYRIPNSGVGTVDTYSLTNMFADTGGEFTGTPSINTTYYLHKSNSIVG